MQLYLETLRYIVDIKEKGHSNSFEHLICSIRVKGTTITIVMIYHPPYSPAAQVTNAQFVKDFAHFLPDVLVKYNNILMLGDFNLHLDNPDDPDATLFTDVLDTMGLIPYVNFPTQVAGHTLDQVYTVVNSRITDRNCRQSMLMSDHYVVKGHVALPHNPTIIKTVKSRKLKNRH